MESSLHPVYGSLVDAHRWIAGSAIDGWWRFRLHKAGDRSACTWCMDLRAFSALDGTRVRDDEEVAVYGVLVDAALGLPA